MKKIYFLIIILCPLFFSSCEKELELSNPNQLSDGTFWKNDNDFQQGLAATYKMLRASGPYSINGIYISNLRGDDFYPYPGIFDNVQLSSFTNTTTNNTASNYYASLYQCIYRANQVIDHAADAEISEDSKKQFIAEGKFLRALFYFELAKNYGAVPLITSLPQTTEDYTQPESSEELVYEQIIQDLKDAKDALPVSYSPEWTGRATKGAAIGMLGKVYVYTKNWDAAIGEFQLISQSDGTSASPYNYDLLANYEDNFLSEFDNNVESLFEVQNLLVGGTTPNAPEGQRAQTTGTPQYFAPAEVQGWPICEATSKIVNEFQQEKTVDGEIDPRAYSSIAWDYEGCIHYQRPFSTFTAGGGSLYASGYFRKYQNYQQPSEVAINQNSEINDKVLRYADVLLLYAEALTMKGEVANAYPLVERVRSRAKLPALAAGYDQDKMMEEIQHQRMLEFVKEGQRFYDLKRWGIVAQELADAGKVAAEYYIQGKSDYLPIPQNEINNNPAINQNPLWE